MRDKKNIKIHPEQVLDKSQEPVPEEGCGGLCIARRDLLKAGASGGVALAVYPHVTIAGEDTGKSISNYPRLKIGSMSNLTDGDTVAFNYPLNDQPNVLVKLGQEAQGGVGPDLDIVAFSVLCPHMGGSLRGRYQHEHGAIGPCPYHFSIFDMTKSGSPVHASATQNLPQVKLEVDGKDIFAIGMTGLVYGYRDNLADGTIADGAEESKVRNSSGTAKG